MDAEMQNQVIYGAISVAGTVICGLFGFVASYLTKIKSEIQYLKEELSKNLYTLDKTLAVMKAKDEAQEDRIESQDERIRKLEVIRFKR